VPEIDNYDLRATLRSIYAGALTADEAKAILDITRRAAAADHKTDIAEMTMLLRIKDLLAQMADEVSLPVSGTFERVDASVLPRGARELAFACAYLVMVQDLRLVAEEQALATTLAAELGLDAERSDQLRAMIDQLVRSSA
jgi:polyhydroxyalkanoate synthesis regulator phasin